MIRIRWFITLLILTGLACAGLPVSFEGLVNPDGAQQNPTLVPGGILFQDDFSRPFSGWDRMQADEGIMDYDGGGYRILVNALETNFWSTPEQEFKDVRMEVDAGKLAGPDENRIGLICRLTNGNYYFFLLTSDGYYGIGIFNLGQAVLLGQSELQFSEKILKGMAVNHLRADCSADRLSMFVNGFEVLTVHDRTLGSGEIGLLAGTFTQPGVDVIFDNFVALQP